MTIKNELLNTIKDYCHLNSAKEVCGFIVESKVGIEFLPINNKHPDSINYFIIDPKDYLEVKSKYVIKYLFHSHLKNEFFSELDIFYQKYHNIDMLLYILDKDEFKEMKCK
jgi:proteasome lid subunit RPN8/RPN11